MTVDFRKVEPGDAGSADQPLDEVFDLLSSQRRRCVLTILADRSQPVAVADLAEVVVAREHGVSLDEVKKADAQAVYTVLYHTHLPKLAAANAIEYDRDRNVVEVSETDSRVQDVLAFATTGGAVR